VLEMVAPRARFVDVGRLDEILRVGSTRHLRRHATQQLSTTTALMTNIVIRAAGGSGRKMGMRWGWGHLCKMCGEYGRDWDGNKTYGVCWVWG